MLEERARIENPKTSPFYSVKLGSSWGYKWVKKKRLTHMGKKNQRI